MKKIFLLFAILAMCIYSFAQQPKSQRMVLIEEFSNASCAPCAAANPAFNALLNANDTKVIPIKWQWDYPGFDPMNAQNPVEVDNRMSYYGLNGVPHAMMDGNVQDLHPSSMTQSMIDAEYAVSSPFTMALTHHLSADYDSIFIKCVFTATTAITMTTPKCQIAITEQEIHFATAPGSNGEKDFYEIMRKMLPNEQGTTIATSWVNGQKDSILFSVALPTYIYDQGQVAVVAWIQDNANKNVKQAAYSMPTPLPLDGSLKKLSGIALLQCTTTITPKIQIKNNGSDPLTSLNINYKIDNGTVDSIIWNGTLNLLDTVSIMLPTLNSSMGSHNFTAYIFRANHAVEFNTRNDTVKAKFNIVGTYAALPLAEGFQGTTFPPTNFIINNANEDNYTWAKATVGGFGNSNASAKLLFYYIPSGNYDEMICSPLTFASATTLGLTFDLAYAQYNSSYIDKLEVFVSTNCGTTWSSVYNKSGTALVTAPTTTSSFTPSASQWRNEYVNLSSYIGQAEVLVKFKGTSGYGNNLYIDNINISESAGIDVQDNNSEIKIYPNPATEIITITNAENSDLMVYDIYGKLIFSDSKINTNYILNVSGFAIGNYIIKLVDGEKVFSNKITILK